MMEARGGGGRTTLFQTSHQNGDAVRRYAQAVEDSLRAQGIAVSVLQVAAGEGSKSFATFEWLMEALLALKPDRKTTLLALGGGVVGDGMSGAPGRRSVAAGGGSRPATGRRPPGPAGAVQAAALATRQVADELLLVGALEVEAADVGARGRLELADGPQLHRQARIAQLPDCFEQRLQALPRTEQSHAA